MEVILASRSPRRRELLGRLDINFNVETREVEEVYPSDLEGLHIAIYLAELKACPFELDIANGTLVITADTMVYLEDRVLGKPTDRNDAIRILRSLSGKCHTVITGVCILTISEKRSFAEETAVYFKELSNRQIAEYVDAFEPYDKAGAYGIQENIPKGHQ